MENWIKGLGIAVSLSFGGSFLFRAGFYKAVGVSLALVPLQPFDITKDITYWPYAVGIAAGIYLILGFAQGHFYHHKYTQQPLPYDVVVLAIGATVLSTALVSVMPMVVFALASATIILVAWTAWSRSAAKEQANGLELSILVGGFGIGIAATTYVLGFLVGSNAVNSVPHDAVALKDRPTVICTVLANYDSGLLVAINHYVVFLPKEEILGISYRMDRVAERSKRPRLLTIEPLSKETN